MNWLCFLSSVFLDSVFQPCAWGLLKLQSNAHEFDLLLVQRFALHLIWSKRSSVIWKCTGQSCCEGHELDLPCWSYCCSKLLWDQPRNQKNGAVIMCHCMSVLCGTVSQIILCSRNGETEIVPVQLDENPAPKETGVQGMSSCWWTFKARKGPGRIINQCLKYLHA